MSESLRILPKKIEFPSDERPCVRPLSDNEVLSLCKQYKISPVAFKNFDYERLADQMPSKRLVKYLLIRDVSSLESIDLATEVASAIASDATQEAKQRVAAVNALCKLQKARAEMAKYLVEEAEKAERSERQDRQRNLPPKTFNLQVNVGANAVTTETKSDSISSPIGKP